MAHVVLVHPEIAWNTGNAGRSCLAAGARLHLVKPLGFSLDEKRVRRAGVGYWERVDPTIHEDWDAFEQTLPELGEPVLLTSEAPRTLYEIELPNDPVFIFGKESEGLPREVRDRYADARVSLPMIDPEIRSLNLSTTVGIVLYEWMRRRDDGRA